MIGVKIDNIISILLSIMFEPVTSSKAPQIIIKQVRSAILRGDIAPGEKLPSSDELMEQFGVSKATLREALRALEYLGLIEIRKGAKGGLYAKEVDMKVSQESLINFFHFKKVSVEHLSEVRKIIEPYAAKVAAETISADGLQQLKEINDRCEAALSKEPDEGINEHLVNFHRVIAQCTGNPVLIFILAFVEDLLQETKELLRPDDGFFRAVVDDHRRIYEALVNGDPDRAFDEMYKDVSKVEEYLIAIKNQSHLVKAEITYPGTDV